MQLITETNKNKNLLFFLAVGSTEGRKQEAGSRGLLSRGQGASEQGVGGRKQGAREKLNFLFPVPCSLFPVPCSLFPITYYPLPMPHALEI
jgi:hypothetical protein